MSWADRKDSRDPENPRYRRGSSRRGGRCGGRCDFHCILGRVVGHGAVAVQPVVWDIPMPQAPAPRSAGSAAADAQASPAAARSPARRPTSRAASAGSKASPPTGLTTRPRPEGKFPLTFNVANIDDAGGVASADVTATSAHWHNRQPERPVRARPEPERLADLEGSPLCRCSRRPADQPSASHICRSPGRRHDSGGARAWRAVATTRVPHQARAVSAESAPDRYAVADRYRRHPCRRRPR